MTLVLVVPVRLAAKACVASRSTVTELGVTVTVMSGEGGEVGGGEEVEFPPHPQTPITAEQRSAMALK